MNTQLDTNQKENNVFEFIPHDNFINLDLVPQDDYYYLVLQIYDATDRVNHVASIDERFDTSITPTNELFLQQINYKKDVTDIQKNESFKELRKVLRSIKERYNNLIMQKFNFITEKIEERGGNPNNKEEYNKIQAASIAEFYSTLSKTLNLISPIYENPEIAKRDGVEEDIYKYFMRSNLPDGEKFEEFYKSNNDYYYYDLRKSQPFKIKKDMVRSVEDPVNSAHDVKFDYKKQLNSQTNPGQPFNQRTTDNSKNQTKFPPDPE